jgi:hypothetical protein
MEADELFFIQRREDTFSFLILGEYFEFYCNSLP